MSTTEASGTSKTKSIRPLLTVFWVTVAVFVFLITYIFTQDFIPDSNRLFKFIFFPGIAALSILGIALIILARSSAAKRSLKLAFILTGVSAVGMPACAILHNLVYGLFILIFGEGFWGGPNGGDEAFFFILALIVFPLLLIISAISVIVILVKSKGNIATDNPRS